MDRAGRLSVWFGAILSRFVTALLAELSAEQLHSAAEDSAPSARIPVPTIHVILFNYASNNSWGELFTPLAGISGAG